MKEAARDCVNEDVRPASEGYEPVSEGVRRVQARKANTCKTERSNKKQYPAHISASEG